MVYKIDPTHDNGGKIVVNPTFLLLDARHHQKIYILYIM